MLLTGAAGALAGAITAGIKSAMSGKFSWKDVGEGALIGGAIGLTGGAAVSLLATGSAFAATGTVMGALGFGASATTVGSLGVAEFGQAQLLLERSVSTAGEQLVNTVAPQATQAMQSAQQIFQNGSLYESIITLNDGRIVDVVGEVIIEDKYLFINHMMMYAREGDIPNEVGPALLKQSLNALQYLAYQQGFEKLRVYGERVLNSSSVNPGMTLDHIFNLIKKFGG